jgi:Ca2+-binding EF-hand superfamily protein
MTTNESKSLVWLDQSVEDIFNELDLTGDNLLSRIEIRLALSARGIPITKTLLDNIFENCDISKEGTITKEEFMIYTQKQNKRLYSIFSEIDSSGDGYLDFFELKKAISRLNPDYSDKQISYMINKMDLNHNGKIDLKDFIKFYHLVPIHNAKMAFDLFSREHIDFGESFGISYASSGMEEQRVK